MQQPVSGQPARAPLPLARIPAVKARCGCVAAACGLPMMAAARHLRWAIGLRALRWPVQPRPAAGCARSQGAGGRARGATALSAMNRGLQVRAPAPPVAVPGEKAGQLSEVAFKPRVHNHLRRSTRWVKPRRQPLGAARARTTSAQPPGSSRVVDPPLSRLRGRFPKAPAIPSCCRARTSHQRPPPPPAAASATARMLGAARQLPATPVASEAPLL
jgi:hypothetical protein